MRGHAAHGGWTQLGSSWPGGMRWCVSCSTAPPGRSEKQAWPAELRKGLRPRPASVRGLSREGRTNEPSVVVASLRARGAPSGSRRHWQRALDAVQCDAARVAQRG